MRRYLESKEQIALFKWIGLFPRLREVSFSIPNAGKRRFSSARFYTLEGMTSGVPDLFIGWPSGGYHGLFIEMKSGKNKLTKNQEKKINAFSNMGYRCIVSYGWEDASKQISEYIGGVSI